MKKILTSWWFSLAIGLVVFVGVIAVLYTPRVAPTEEKPAGETDEQAAEAGHPPDAVSQLLAATNTPPLSTPLAPIDETEVGAPGTLRWDDPAVRVFVKDLENQRAGLAAKERELNALSERLQLERQHIGSVTQMVAQAIADFQKAQTNNIIMMDKDNDRKYRTSANMLTNMAPANAVIILKELPTDEVVQVLQRMGSDAQRALIIEEMAKNSPTNAAEISKAFLRLATKPANP